MATEVRGDPRFRALLDELWELHCRKAADYGDEEAGDFLANLRGSEELNVPAWLGALVRWNDKVKRIKAFAKKRKLANESFEDSLLDLSAYSLLVLILYREANPV